MNLESAGLLNYREIVVKVCIRRKIITQRNMEYLTAFLH